MTSNSDRNPGQQGNDQSDRAEYRGQALAARSVIGGMLMGLANLVPGISGGTMLLAVGIYPQFIAAIADLSTFRFKGRTVLMISCVVLAALVAIAGFARVVGALVVDHRWVMYSLFIGLTLGGVPLLWRMLRPADGLVVVTSIAGIAVMVLLAVVDPGQSAATTDAGSAYALLLLSGIAGGAAMILPGISGAYLLLILGQYLAILASIDQVVTGLRAGEWAQVFDAMHVIVPVALGVAVGVVGVSNLLKILLARYERGTLGLLLGLLFGAVIGLWPFQQPIAPQVGDVIRGVVLESPEMAAAVQHKYWATRAFTPSLWQVLASLGLILLGLGASTAVARLGTRREAR